MFFSFPRVAQQYAVCLANSFTTPNSDVVAFDQYTFPLHSLHFTPSCQTPLLVPRVDAAIHANAYPLPGSRNTSPPLSPSFWPYSSLSGFSHLVTGKIVHHQPVTNQYPPTTWYDGSENHCLERMLSASLSSIYFGHRTISTAPCSP